LIVLLALLTLLSAVLRGPADIAALTASADAVVHARVVRTASAWGAGGPSSGVIYTQVTLAPLEWWKGAAQGTVTVRVPGGAVGEWDQLVQGAARFGEGEEVVVFLRKLAPGMFDVDHWALGKFAVGAARPGLPKRALRDRSGLSCTGCGADEDDDLALDELHARVLRGLRP
jgi:hypothetical protein